MLTRILASLLAAIGFLAAAPAAYGAPCTVVAGTPPERAGTSDTSDLTLNGSDSAACQVAEGNSNQGPGGNTLGVDFGPGGWTLLFKFERSGSSINTGPINGIAFSNYQLDVDPDNSGTFAFDWTGGPNYIDFMFSMHGGNTSAFFFFDELLLSPAAGSASGTWAIHFRNNGGSEPGFSNGQFWARNGSIDCQQAPTAPGCGETSSVPEPGSLALMTLGALIAASSIRRRAARR